MIDDKQEAIVFDSVMNLFDEAFTTVKRLCFG